MEVPERPRRTKAHLALEFRHDGHLHLPGRGFQGLLDDQASVLVLGDWPMRKCVICSTSWHFATSAHSIMKVNVNDFEPRPLFHLTRP